MISRSLFVFLLFICFVQSVPPTPPDWRDAIHKAREFVRDLTLDEMVSLTTGVGWMNGPCVGNIPPIPRKNFPGLCLDDSPTGVRFADFASSFPASINAASTFDRSLIYKRAVAMGKEVRGKGVNIALQPMMNLGRVAAGGRNWEGFGGDPYLVAEASAQTVKGVQAHGAIACAKHYIGNEQEHYRTTSSSNIDDRTLHEIYALPFYYSVLAGVGSVMCSYNLVNNTYACENERTLNEILKGQFGFKGFVMSDWAATMSGVPSVLAGLDMTMPGDIVFSSGNSYFGKNLTQAIVNGAVHVSRLTDMAVRILTPYFHFNQTDYPPVAINFVDRTKAARVSVGDDHYKIIREVGAASTILLKNSKNILPFGSQVPGNGFTTYGLIGSDAGPALAGTGPNTCSDHGCVDGTLAQGWGSGTADFPYLITPLESVQAEARVRAQTVKYLLNDWNINAAKALASQVSVPIVFVSADSGEDYITINGNEGDRNNLTLWRNGDNLVQAVASVNNQTVVVIHSVGPVLLPWINNPNIAAVVWAGLPGQESGNSLVDVLFGAVNPSGRLPFTIANNRTDYPADVLYKSTARTPQINYTEALLIDYRWFDANNIQPAFEFGFGLSYTTFNYTSINVRTVHHSDIVYEVDVTISNAGSVGGHEVAQLYLGFPARAGEPPKVLKGFERVYIRAKHEETVTFSLAKLDLSIWDVVSQDWQILGGVYQVFVGASSRDIRLTSSISVNSLY